MLTVINFFMSVTSALEISLDFPDSVNLNEEFTVTINADTSETHDVKIFVHSSPDAKIESSEYISEIYNSNWKNPWYYLKETFPDKKDYQIKVTKFSQTAEICVRLRKTGTNDFGAQCKPIIIKESNQVNEQQEKSSTSSTKESADINNKDKITEQDNEKSVFDSAATSSNNDNKIIINSPTSKQETTQKIFITKQEKIRLGVVYIFTVFCLIIIILLVLRRL